ncbi:MAG: glycosyltransferase family 4 protein [Rhabdochlamydiaceae bacterium]
MKDKKVCIDIRMAFHSGIGTYIRNLLPYIKKSNLSLKVLAPFSYIEKWPELKTYDLIPFNAPIYSLREQIELSLKIPLCDLFWSPHYNIPLGPIRAKRRLTSVHDVYHLAYGYRLGWLKKSYAKIMLQQVAYLSDHIVTISNFSKREIVQWAAIEEKKISVAYLGVNPLQFSLIQENEALQKIKHLYGLPHQYILFVGNLMFHKNLSRLLQAWLLVQSKHRSYKLVLVGKKDRKSFYENVMSENPSLKNSVLQLGNIEQSHLPIIYQLAKGFILPSLYEGFGLPPLESMMMQCPTIVSKAASLPEVCQEASLYVDPYDVHDIAQKICELIENPTLRQTLVDKGLDHIKHFSWEKTAQTHLEIIYGLIS